MTDHIIFNKVDEIAASIHNNLIQIRRDLHQIPELSADLPKTRAYLLKILKSYPLEIRENVGDNGIVAVLRGKHEGLTVAYRADMDALAMDEETDLPYQSTHPGKMHACGHDGHMTIALGLVKIFSAIKEDLKGQIVFIFQPAEEDTGGADLMIKDGALSNPEVDYVFGAHIWPSLPSGQLGLIKGPIMAGTDILEIEIEGKGGHGAIPHKAINPIVVGSRIVSEVEGIKNYFVPSSENSVISFGSFVSGAVNNVIPHRAKLLGSVRTFSLETQSIYKKQLHHIVEQVGSLFGAQCGLNYIHNYPPTINDEKVIDRIEKFMKAYELSDHITYLKEPSMGAEDFSFFLQKKPGAFIFVGTRNEAKGIVQEIHHPKYNLDEDIFEFAVATFAKMMLEFLD